MAGTERGKWMVQKIVSCFAQDGVDAVKANSCLRRAENNAFLKGFFDGSNGEQRVFVFHQPPCNDEGETEEGAAPELTLGVGTVSRMAGRCCAFVRGVKPGEPIAADKASTTELMFTEMHSSALGALSTFLDGYGVPAFAHSEQWGRAGPDQRKDFSSDMSALAATVKDAVISLDGGLDALLQAHRVSASGDIAQAFTNHGLRQNGGGSGAVASDVVSLLGDLLDELGADFLIGIVELDLLGDGDTVVGNGGSAPRLFENDVAALGAEGDLDRVGEGIHARLEPAAGLDVEFDELCHV